MNMPLHNSPETYSEKSLHELLEFASKDLLPGPGYSLSLEGVLASGPTHRELEAYFNAELDASSGANIRLVYDAASAQLVIDSFAVDLKANQGTAQLLRTELSGYIPVVFNKSGKPFSDPKRTFSEENARMLLHGFGINDAPLTDPSEYRSWLSSLLAITQGWKITEHFEVPVALTNESAQSYVLINEQSFDRKTQSRVDTKKFKRNIVLFRDEDNSFSHVESTYESVSHDLVHSYAVTYVETYDEVVDPIVEKYSDETAHKFIKLPNDKDTYLHTKNALREFIHIRKNIYEATEGRL